jgi:hypothetical protein
MDQITESLMAEFVKANQLEDLSHDKQFEHLTAFITLRRHHTRTFDTADIVVGAGGDTTIDSVAIIVNGTLVTDIDATNELIGRNGYIDASFVFVQAERSDSFDSAKAGSFGFGVEDFFKEAPQLPRNEKIADAAAFVRSLYARGTLFRSKPSCRLYYVTTGTWKDDANIMARVNGGKAALEATQLFGSIDFVCFGANELHRLYNQTKNAVKREFLFKERNEIPSIRGVTQAWLGFVPASELIKIISDDSGDDILGNIFDENVRDWQDFNTVNSEIRDTLTSVDRGRFVLMNNGVTIITRNMSQLGSNFALDDFQIVNGCQTSNVLFAQRNENLSDVSVPLRLILTQDEDVIEAIVFATNRQTELKPEQLYALTVFSKKLELYFKSIPEPYTLYYERRDCQYDRFPGIERKRIIGPQSLIRAFASMFLDEPVRATRQYKSIRDLVGVEIFKEGDRLEPYYVAAFAAYRLDFLFRNQKLDSEYKPARYHILMTLRYLMNKDRFPRMNSRDMEKRCRRMTEILWDAALVDSLIAEAAKIVREVVGKDFDRDHIRIEPVKDALLERFGAKVGHSKA